MNRKRFLGWIGVVAMASMLVGGCAPSPSGNVPAAEQAGDEEKITLTIWDTGTEYYQWVEDVAIPLFKEKHPNVEIVHTGIPYDQYSLKIDTAATANDLPDLIADEVPGPNSRWYKAGLFVPLNDYMAADSINRADFCGLIDTSVTMEDQVFMLPMYVNFWGMLYNKQMFAAAELPMLDTDSVITFSDWLEYARKLNKPAETLDARVWGSQMMRPDWNAMPAGMSDPYYLGADGRTCTANADTPEMIRMWELIRDAYKEDLTPETGQTLLGDQDSWLFFTEGKVAISYGDMSMANQAVEKGIDVGITGQPVTEEGVTRNVHTYGMGYGITRASKHPELAWEFIKLTATVIPMELIGAKEYGEATAGIPCYQPLVADYIEKSNNPFLADAQKLIARYEAPPFAPDFYAGSTPIWEEFNVRVLEKGEDVATVIQDATNLCQKAVDDMWEQYDSLE